MNHQFMQIKYGNNLINLFTHSVMNGTLLVWPSVLVENVDSGDVIPLQGIHTKPSVLKVVKQIM